MCAPTMSLAMNAMNSLWSTFLLPLASMISKARATSFLLQAGGWDAYGIRGL